MAMLNDLQDAYRSEEFQRLFASWVSGHAHLRSSAVGTFSAIYKKKDTISNKKHTRPEKACCLLLQLLRLLPSQKKSQTGQPMG